MSPTPILRRTRKDWIATGIITAVCAFAIGGSVVTANIREAHLVQAKLPTNKDVEILAQAPSRLTEAYRVASTPVAGQFRPLVSRGLLITTDGHKVTAHNLDGSEAWSYSRDKDTVCSLGSAWDKVVITYRTGVGCGDVVSINAATGKYANTRSSINSPAVVAVSSNDRVGTLSPDRLDLWRSDLVRTIEYGDVEDKQEPDMQPNEACTLSSALTRKENVALTESCPGNQGTWLRMLGATPEDSRKGNPAANIAIPADGARLVAVGEHGAAVYVPGTTPRIVSYDDKGKEVASSEVKQSPLLASASTPFAPATGDLPHHMTWFDGSRLYLFSPANLSLSLIVEDVLGTGIALGERLLVPTQQGIAVLNWDTGAVERIIPVDRGGYHGPVYLNLAGVNIAETRGDTVVVLRAAD